MDAPVPRKKPEQSVSLEDTELFEGVELAIILPTLNEQDGLARTLLDIPFDRMRAQGWAIRPLVVDGGSTDQTLKVATSHGIPVLHQRSRGKGAAIRDALEWLRGRGVRFAVVMDADCTYPGSLVPAVMSLLESGSDLVVGVRQPVFKPTSAARDFVHRMGNSLLNFSANQLAGMPILDICSGFWGVHVEMAHRLALETTGFEIEAELFGKAFRAGLQITQIPIPYRERVGVAKLRAARDGARIFLTVLRFGRRRIAQAFPLPRPTMVRDLLSLLLVDDSRHLVVLADRTRRSDAEMIVRRFRMIHPSARVVLQVREGRTSIEPISPDLMAIEPPAVAVLPPLPLGAGGSKTAPGAVVRLPRWSRLIELGEGTPTPTGIGGTGYPSAAVDGVPSGGYRLELDAGRPTRLAPVRFLVANVIASRREKELALLRANAAGSEMVVWSGEGQSRYAELFA